jgi:hypothetical protein
MTSTELKSQIDSEITNETAPNSVSTIDVGTNLKDIVDYVDQEISTLPSPSAKFFDANSFNGNGDVSDAYRLKTYFRTSQLIASGGGNPSRVKNFFEGMQLPSGITETFTRVSSGIYRATYSGADTITALDLTSGTDLFHFSFTGMPTNTGSDLKIQSIGSTNSGGVRTIFVEFHNLPSGVLTDNFNGYLYYEVKFFS